MRGTLTELASIDGMPSEPTLRKMIVADPDFAGIIKRGSNGDAYEIDLRVAAEYVIGLEQRKRDAEIERQQQLAQLGLDLGLGKAADQPAGMTIADRKALLEEEIVAVKLGKLRGEIIHKASVEAALSAFLIKLAQQMSTFGSRLAKRADVSRATQIEIDRLIEADQAALARWMRDLDTIGKQHGDDGIDGADAAASALDSSAG